MLNSIFGGKFTSRLNLRLRERDGSTYGVSSFLQERLSDSRLVVACAVETESAAGAVAGALEEMARLREELVDPDELVDTQNYLTGVVPFRLQTLGGKSNQAQTQWLFGLPANQLALELAALERITADEIRHSAQTTLLPEAAVVVLVGPAKRLEAQLGTLRAQGFREILLESGKELLLGNPLPDS
jgi:predicted Zn-dependent peptidase